MVFDNKINFQIQIIITLQKNNISCLELFIPSTDTKNITGINSSFGKCGINHNSNLFLKASKNDLKNTINNNNKLTINIKNNQNVHLIVNIIEVKFQMDKSLSNLKINTLDILDFNENDLKNKKFFKVARLIV